jgi:hypothetical protein
MRDVAAWTAPAAPYPEYLNFSRDGDEVVVTLREEPCVGKYGHTVNGNLASVRVPIAAMAAMCSQMVAEFLK